MPEPSSTAARVRARSSHRTAPTRVYSKLSCRSALKRNEPGANASASKSSILLLAAVILATGTLIRPNRSRAAEVSILNVTYDPTRELYQDYNAGFGKYWKAQTGDDVTVNQSHAGSGKQARAVIDG